MMKVDDKKLVSEICGVYSYLRESRNSQGKCYSETKSKKLLAEEYKLKVSEIDKILYGRKILTSKLSDEQKNSLVDDYNAGVSIRQLAKDYTAKCGEKISTAHLYKVLHEMENREKEKDIEIKWRGTPKQLRKNSSLEARVIQIQPQQSGMGFWKGVKYAAAGFLTGIILYCAADYLGVNSAYATTPNPPASQPAIQYVMQDARTNNPLPNPLPLQEATQDAKTKPWKTEVHRGEKRSIEETIIPELGKKMIVHRNGEVSQEEILEITPGVNVDVIIGRDRYLKVF